MTDSEDNGSVGQRIQPGAEELNLDELQRELDSLRSRQSWMRKNGKPSIADFLQTEITALEGLIDNEKRMRAIRAARRS